MHAAHLRGAGRSTEEMLVLHGSKISQKVEIGAYFIIQSISKLPHPCN